MDRDLVVGVDIGGTNTVFGIVDEEGHILAQDGFSTQAFPAVSDFINALYNRVTEKSKELKGELVGLGMGAPNGNFYTGRIEFAPNLPWKEAVPMGDLLKKRFDIPVRITNDANAAALGEMLFGKAKGKKHFIEITLGTGLGGGIVIDGKLLYGFDGFAGELGHIIVEHGGRQCTCGLKGCLETYVSATGVVRSFKERIKSDKPSTILYDKTEITSKDIAQAAAEGDEVSMEVMDFTAQMLGRALASFVAFSAPEVFILFGGLANAGKLLIEPTKRYMNENLLPLWKDKIGIEVSILPENTAAILGAAALIWKERIEKK